MSLLIDRARSIVPEFAVTEDNSDAVVQLCNQLDGMPLAIELAATRLRALSVTQIVERLDRRFQLLTGGDRTGLPRQQTLRALIDWSCELCTPAEQLLWARLSAFPGSFDLESAEKVCGFGDLGPPADSRPHRPAGGKIDHFHGTLRRAHPVRPADDRSRVRCRAPVPGGRVCGAQTAAAQPLSPAGRRHGRQMVRPRAGRSALRHEVRPRQPALGPGVVREHPRGAAAGSRTGLPPARTTGSPGASSATAGAGWTASSNSPTNPIPSGALPSGWGRGWR